MKKKEDEKIEFKVKQKWVFGIFVFLVLGVFLIFLTNSTTAVGESVSCCERTVDGAWCQNSPPATCDTNYRSPSTSCEATSFCKLGTCVDSNEGLCRPNVPQKVCQDDGGVWVEGTPEEISQCQLGCCYIGDGASWVTQTRCTSLSSFYGVDTNFRQDIDNQLECIASASPQVRGACVLDDGFSRDCRMLTKGECQELEATSGETEVEFHEGFLCSAEVLATNCGSSQRTTCVEDKDAVYFLDSCGNIANVYDASKVNNQEYWTMIKDRDESCNPNSNNAGSATCGNCDYLLGSTCKAYERGNSQTPNRPRYGDFVCADLSCEYKGETYQHGEKWCGESEGIEENLPGSEYFTLTCYSGEVTIEQCDSFRNTICLESESNEGFRTASCVANRWQDCTSQDNQEDCENSDQRDCQWIEGESILRDERGVPFGVNEEGELVPRGQGRRELIGVSGGDAIYYNIGASCVPLHAPGSDFWNAEGETEELCMLASEDCIVKFERGVLDDWDCKENCHCLTDEWEEQRNNLCIALGDCGSSKNFIGVEGYHNESVVEYRRDIE